MSNDSFVRVATDSTGKRIDMDLLPNAGQDTGAAVDIYRQRAVLVGETAELLWSINQSLKKILAVQRAQLAILQNTSTLSVSEDDFYVQQPSEE